jgi:aquaporin Z
MKLPDGAQTYVAEFIGTFMLVFSIGCNVLAGSRVWAAASIACTLVILVYIFGSVSGAHLNPAVSVAMGLMKRKTWKEVAIYAGAQILGGICAAVMYSVLLWEVVDLKPAVGYTWWQVALAELLYTCMLVFVVLHVDGLVDMSIGRSRNPAAGNQYFGLAIGFVLMAAIPGAGHISGGCFNPAVAMAISFSSDWFNAWWIVYVIAEVLGGCLAMVLFKATDPLTKITASGEVATGAKLASEFVGTFYLVLTVGLNVLGKSTSPVFSIAASLMCMIYALGRVSGAHFNPAVTLAILARRGGYISTGNVIKYWGAQFLGGLVAAIFYVVLESGRTFPLAVGANFSLLHAGIAEILFTFLLCYVVLALTTVRKAEGQLTPFFGLAIASCVTAGGIAVGTISGGILNPAVAFGISLTNTLGGGTVWTLIPYVCFQILGGAFAAVVFQITRPEEIALKPSL